MKSCFKPLSLLLSALLLVGGLASCGGETVLTPEEIYEKVENAEDLKATVEMELTDLMTTTMTVSKDGDKSHIVTDMEMMGFTQTSEAYTEKVGSTLISYTKTDDGWEKTEEEDSEEDESAVSSFEELFKSANFGEYDKETGRYEMKADASVDADGMTMTKAYIEIKGSTIVIYAEVAVEESGMSASGFMKMTIEFTDTTVTIPEV